MKYAIKPSLKLLSALPLILGVVYVVCRLSVMVPS